MQTTLSQLMELVITALMTMIASSGFWLYIQKRNESHDLKQKLLIGLAHDRITYLASKFIERGSITQEEYENLFEYLYKPYMELGGNGTAARLMDDVKSLPFRRGGIIPDTKTNPRKGTNDENIR